MAKLLTKKKAAWAKQFKPKGYAKGKPLNYPAGVEARYNAKLQRLVDKMTDDTARAIERFFKTPTAKDFFAEDASVTSQAKILTNALTARFEALFAAVAKPTAEQMAEGADKASATALHSSLKEMSGGLSLPTKMLTGPMKQVTKAVVVSNVGLIKSISSDYLGKVQDAVMRSITTGNGLADLQPFLEQQKGVTKRKAKIIALDQTKKAYNGINRARMQKIGVQQFEWLHTGGSQKPRPDHVAMSGNIYSFDNLPVIDSKTGERGIPGQAPNCGCRMLPVVKFNTGEDDDS